MVVCLQLPYSLPDLPERRSHLGWQCSQVYTSASLLPLKVVPNSHMVFVTGITFQQPSKKATGAGRKVGVLSISADSSARVTEVKEASDMMIL